MRRKCFGFLLVLSFLFSAAQASETLSVDAKGAVLIDGASGRILFAQNADAMLPEASCTKIMTALVALENSTLEEEVTAGKNAHGVTGTSIYLSEGETLTMEQMLYGLMLRSGNDAAVAIAEHIGGSVEGFTEMMNKRAKELDADANFVNPHGLDAEGHKASALGLARIMREAMTIPEFRQITGTQKKIIPWVGNEYSRVLQNKNRLLADYEGATGGKTGYTSKAGRCLVFSAERDGMELIGVVLNCYTWFDTAETILDYGFENFRMEHALDKDERAASVNVKNGTAKTVSAVAAETLRAAVEKDAKPELIIETETLEAPIKKGEHIGRAMLKLNGEILAECRLIAQEAVEKKDAASAFKTLLQNWILLPA